MWNGFMKRSVLQDENPADAIDIHFKNYRRGALFLVFFAVFSSTSSWDWLMSIDIHWFSTLFGWYVFAGSWTRSEEHTSELQSRPHLVCRLLLEKKKKTRGKW